MFAHSATVNFGQLLENYKSSRHIWATLFSGQVYALSLTKMVWATLWAIFSRTHLVALAEISRNSKISDPIFFGSIFVFLAVTLQSVKGGLRFSSRPGAHSTHENLQL
jgi:hypothetical protein